MTDRTFAAALRAARETAGLSQAELGRKAGLTGSYVCLLESGRKRPPTERRVAALCRALGVEERDLADLAALERAPDAVRRRLERVDRARRRAVRNRDGVLRSVLLLLAQGAHPVYDLGDHARLTTNHRALVGRLLRRARHVPRVPEAVPEEDALLGDVAASDRESLADALPEVLAAATAPRATPPPHRHPVRTSLDRPTEADETLELSGLCGPGSFLWRYASDDAWPRVEPGDVLVVDPEAKPAPGDLVAVRIEGRGAVRVYEPVGSEAWLKPVRPDLPPLRVPRDRLDAAGVVVWVLRSLA